MQKGLLLKVLIAMAGAALAGLTLDPQGIVIRGLGLVGKLFLNALMLVVVPLVVSSIITGTAKIGSEPSFGTMGRKTFGACIVTNLTAILIGWLLVIMIQPGLSVHPLSSGASRELEILAQGDALSKIEMVLTRLIPSNILYAAAHTQMLGLILFSLLFGYFTSQIESQPASILIGFWKGLFQVMMKMTHFIMRALPLGVFALVAHAIASTGAEALQSVGMFAFTVVAGLVVYGLILLTALKVLSGVSPRAHLKAIAPALATAFSTSSSAATLPVMMESLEKAGGISNRICSFTLPLGTSVNLAGSALQTCVAVFFIAQVYGMTLDFPLQLMIVGMTLLTSLASAGIPSASLISVMMIAQTIGLPVEGVGLILALERLLDMARTTLNVLTNSCSAVFVARAEGERTLLIEN